MTKMNSFDNLQFNVKIFLYLIIDTFYIVVRMCVCVSQDVKAGEVRNIKSMWENMGETFPQDEPHGKVHHAV